MECNTRRVFYHDLNNSFPQVFPTKKRQVITMVSKGHGRLFKRKDNKYLLYLPKDLCEDSAFPFKLTDAEPSTKMKVKFDEKTKTIIAEPMT